MSDEVSLRDVRLQKLARMRELGHDPYRVEKFDVPQTAKQLLDTFEEGKPVTFAGRVVSYRLMGKAGFAHLSDGDTRIQGYFRKDDLGEVGWELYNLLDIGDHVGVTGKLFVTKTGEKSIHIETLTPLSKALHAIPFGKEKDGQVFYGLTDVDQRYRHRHLDLLTNAEARKTLLDRMKIVRAVRHYFDGQGYLEVETPLLQLEAGGAAARPFLTHFNAYDIDVKLRISLELYLKRIICGDVPRVYEIGRVFRNEGVSQRHNPEFTLLEFYETYANLETMMTRVEECFRSVALEVFGDTIVRMPIAQTSGKPRAIDLIFSRGGRLSPDSDDFKFFQRLMEFLEASQLPESLDDSEWYTESLYEALGKDAVIISVSTQERRNFALWDLQFQGGCSLSLSLEFTASGLVSTIYQTFDFGKPWKRINLLEEIERRAGIPASALSNLATAKEALKKIPLTVPGGEKRVTLELERSLGGLIEKLLEVYIEPTLQEPTFVVGYPIETSPLAKKDPNNPKMTRRFEGYIRGKEVCNAFSEINDPIDQRERFEQQLSERAKGDDEAHPMDEEFLYALECGMPPTGGCGIGIDRMAMMLTGSDHIREVLLFPFMRPHVAAAEESASE